MTATLIQSSFQFGEVSETLHAKVDQPIYYRAVRRLRNTLVTPQGGATRRFGTQYIDDLTDPSIADYTQIKEFIFDYEDGERYVCVFYENTIKIYWSDNPSVDTPISVVTTYSASEIESLSFAQSASLLFIAQGNHSPAILRRTSATGVTPPTFSLEAAPTFNTYPTFDFEQNYDSYDFQVKVGATNMTIAQNKIGQVVTVVSSTAMFSTDFEGGLFFTDTGVIRFTTFSSDTVMNGRILNIFDDDGALFHGTFKAKGQDSVVTEKAFSANRGWPKVVAFYQNRLWLANTRSLPGGIFGSNYNGYTPTTLNYDDSEALDTNALSTVLQGRKGTIIKHVIGFKSLLVFTSSGLFSTPLFVEVPLTPTNISFLNLQTSDAANNVLPLVFDNDVVFFDKGGKKVKTININAVTQHYETKNVSVLAPHLIDQPYSATVFENSSLKDGNWMFMINSGSTVLSDGTEMEGTMSVYQNVPEQEIVAWSLSTTDGFFRHVVSDEDVVYFINERVIDGNTKFYLEKLNFDYYMDCTTAQDFTGSPTDTITNLSYLESKEVRVKSKVLSTDERTAVMERQTVTGGGISIEYEVEYVEVGLNFDPEIVPLPLYVPTQSGVNLYKPKTVRQLYVDFYQSLNIEVDGNLIPPFRFNEDIYNDPAIPKTDFVAVTPMTGWDPRRQIVIGQSDPLPMTIIGLGFEIGLGG